MFTCDEVLPFLGAETNSLFTELCSSMLSANICCSLFIFSPGGGGERGTPLFGLCGHVPLNRVWFSRSWVYDFTIKRLEQGVFLDWKPSKSVKTCEERPTFAIPIIFFLNIYFSAKNYLILYAKQSKSGSESSVSCHGLKQGSEMRSLCLKQGRGLLASAAHLYTNFPWVFPPPPSPPGIFNLARWCSIDQVLVTRSSNESNFTDNKTRNIFKHGKDTCRWGNMDAVICDKHLSSNFSVVWVCKIKVCPLKNSAARVNFEE